MYLFPSVIRLDWFLLRNTWRKASLERRWYSPDWHGHRKTHPDYPLGGESMPCHYALSQVICPRMLNCTLHSHYQYDGQPTVIPVNECVILLVTEGELRKIFDWVGDNKTPGLGDFIVTTWKKILVLRNTWLALKFFRCFRSACPRAGLWSLKIYLG